MPRRSSVRQLDPQLREAVDDAIRDGRATLDEIVALVRGMGGEVSRSALGRYRQGFEQSLLRYREAKEIAGRWLALFREDPDSDVGRLLAEMAKTLAFQTMAQAGNGDEAPDPLVVARLARAVKALTDTDLVKQQIEARVAERVRGAVDKALGEAAAASDDGRLSVEVLDRIRREIYGVVA
jgi:hypothetical protein